jgi:NMD protein affecting ribosome stability and mRNA decay
MNEPTPNRTPQGHHHEAVTLRAIVQQSGVPYELERKVCTRCSRVLEERRLRRAAAA